MIRPLFLIAVTVRDRQQPGPCDPRTHTDFGRGAHAVHVTDWKLGHGFERDIH